MRMQNQKACHTVQTSSASIKQHVLYVCSICTVYISATNEPGCATAAITVKNDCTGLTIYMLRSLNIDSTLQVEHSSSG